MAARKNRDRALFAGVEKGSVPFFQPWIMAVGATTLKRGDLGFSGMTARWNGKITKATDAEIETFTTRPGDWPEIPAGWQSYAAIDTGGNHTGFAAAAIGPDRIRVDRFPVPAASKSFDWLALRFLQNEE